MCIRDRAARTEAGREDDSYIVLDIGPIGQLLEPMGTLTFDEACLLYTSLEKLARRFCCICFVKMDMIFRKFMGIVELKSMRMRRRILILGALAVPVVQWFLHR